MNIIHIYPLIISSIITTYKYLKISFSGLSFSGLDPGRFKYEVKASKIILISLEYVLLARE